MGTHTKSPSLIAFTNTTLSSHLAANPSFLGEDVIKKFDAADGNLPFLFKVLAIEKALSIQSHPDKKTAERLHAEQPDIYKDANHKPEMALALTPFTALCGFMPFPEITAFLTSTPEFAALVPPAISQNFITLSAPPSSSPSFSPNTPEQKVALKNLFTALMTADPDLLSKQVELLVSRFKAGNEHESERKVKDLVLRLDEQFPGDIGIFCAFVLNYVELEPGEAIYLGAGEPHAYVSGDIIECMANSDNVIRAGLTPKLRDIPNLISTLTYNSAPPSAQRLQTSSFPAEASAASFTTLYDPPIPEFSVLRVVIPQGKSEDHPGVAGPSLAIITAGGGKIKWQNGESEVVEGEVIFIAARTGVQWESGTEEGLVVYRAFVEA